MDLVPNSGSNNTAYRHDTDHTTTHPEQFTPKRHMGLENIRQTTPETLLYNVSKSYIGMELLANIPQIDVSLLYYLLNDTLARMLIAADYNEYAISRRPLRVSFSHGEQRLTFYLTIPYRYSVPFSLAFTLIHCFASVGIFYVQILPYGIYGHPIYSAIVMTCSVDTIPLQIPMFLAIAMFFVVAFLGAKKFKSQTMPAAFKAVIWGALERSDSEEHLHWSLSSKEVDPP